MFRTRSTSTRTGGSMDGWHRSSIRVTGPLVRGLAAGGRRLQKPARKGDDPSLDALEREQNRSLVERSNNAAFCEASSRRAKEIARLTEALPLSEPKVAME